jgi:uncharacterized protein (TIGR02922 family)
MNEKIMPFVTVLYYYHHDILKLSSEVLQNLPISERGRVLLSAKFREDKTIVAILRGDVEVLNTLGERLESNLKRA